MGLITKKGKYKTIYEVDPSTTYFIAYYTDKTVKGKGLDNTGWDQLDNGVVSIQYVLSTGDVIRIPKYKKYLHLVEASMSIDKDSKEFYGKNYHYVYIKGYTGSAVLTHRICLRSPDKEAVGSVDVILEGVEELDNYGNAWKEAV